MSLLGVYIRYFHNRPEIREYELFQHEFDKLAVELVPQQRFLVPDSDVPIDSIILRVAQDREVTIKVKKDAAPIRIVTTPCSLNWLQRDIEGKSL